MGAELNKALAKLQGQLPHIPKGETGEVKGITKQGKEFSYTYTYADLHGVSAAILPLMSGVGLAFTARPTINEAGKFVLAYSLLHESGESLDGEYALPDPDRYKQQEIGGVITYARRYCLCAVTGVAPAEDDDDAQSASKSDPQPKPRRAPPKRPAADHARLRKGTMDPEPGDRPADRGPVPAEDHWNGQAAGELPKPAGRIGAIQAHFKRIGITDRGVRLGYTARLAGLDTLASTNDLTDEQQALVLKGIGMCKDQKKLDLLLSSGDAPQEATK